MIWLADHMCTYIRPPSQSHPGSRRAAVAHYSPARTPPPPAKPARVNTGIHCRAQFTPSWCDSRPRARRNSRSPGARSHTVHRRMRKRGAQPTPAEANGGDNRSDDGVANGVAKGVANGGGKLPESPPTRARSASEKVRFAC